MSRAATNWAVLLGMAKQIPWAVGMMAVLTPITSPAEFIRGPPLLPGLRAASVWITLSISRPELARNERARALTTPAVTVAWKPYGLPMATTSWPGWMALVSPSVTIGSAD